MKLEHHKTSIIFTLFFYIITASTTMHQRIPRPSVPSILPGLRIT